MKRVRQLGIPELDGVEEGLAERALREARREAVFSVSGLVAVLLAVGLALMGAMVAGWAGAVLLSALGVMIFMIVANNETRVILWRNGFGHTEPLSDG
jgi:hypothetical protein